MNDVIVLGDSLPELAAALDLAEVGLSVRIYPHASDEDRADPRPTEAVRDLDGSLRAFLAHLAAPIGAVSEPETAVGVGPVEVPPVPPLLLSAKGEWLPQPEPAVFGVPAVPLSSAALALLGGGPALRAAVDRIRPVLTIGKTHEFGDLVRTRMGRGVRDRLVEPLTREAYGVPAEHIDVAIIAPGLNEALTRMGSLSGAVLDYAERDVARETRILPATGWGALREALIERLRLYTVEFAPSPAREVRAIETGWTVAAEADGSEPAVTARALVRGAGGTSDPELVELLGGSRRVIGTRAILDPGFHASHPDQPAVQAVQLADGTDWAVRFARAETGWEATASGPAEQEMVTTAAAYAAARDRITEAVIAAGATPCEGTAEASMPFAPYATTAQRQAAVSQLEAWCEQRPGQLPSGVALHGGDLSVAIADARARAVQLRRHLTGIAD